MYRFMVTLERSIFQISEEFEIEVPEIEYKMIEQEALRHAGAVDWEGDPYPPSLGTFTLIEEEETNEPKIP